MIETLTPYQRLRHRLDADPEYARKYGEQRAAVKRRVYSKNRELVKEAKKVPCADCGGSFPVYAMDLDHVPERGPKKLILQNIGGKTGKQVREEIAKCDVVCANCHRERSHQRGSKDD